MVFVAGPRHQRRDAARNSPAPSVDLREQFSDWVKKSLRAEACATGITPGRTLIRRLNRDEYAATVRDLLEFIWTLRRRFRRMGRAERLRQCSGNTIPVPAAFGEVHGSGKFAIDFAAKEFNPGTRF